VLPNIADILETVDRQMLLILKTNDLIRGIETTLQTQRRMTAYWVMAKCCIRSATREEIEHSKSFWKKFFTALAANWSILKLNLRYLYLGLLELNLYSTLKLLFA
jgi:aarF domain-containing kinase